MPTAHIPPIVGIILEVLSDSTGDVRTLEFNKVDTPVVSIGRRPSPRGTGAPPSTTPAKDGDAATFRCPVISRRHAQIAYSNDGEVYVVDRQSHHGTWVLKVGQTIPTRIEPHVPITLRGGEVVTFGKSVTKDGRFVEPIAVRVHIKRAATPSSPTTSRIADLLALRPPTPTVAATNSTSNHTHASRRWGHFGLDIPTSLSTDSSSSSDPSDEDDVQEIPPPARLSGTAAALHEVVDLTQDDLEVALDAAATAPTFTNRTLGSIPMSGSAGRIPGFGQGSGGVGGSPMSLGASRLPSIQGLLRMPWMSTFPHMHGASTSQIVDLTRGSTSASASAPASPNSPPAINSSALDFTLPDDDMELESDAEPLHMSAPMAPAVTGEGDMELDSNRAGSEELPYSPTVETAHLAFNSNDILASTAFTSWLTPDEFPLPSSFPSPIPSPLPSAQSVTSQFPLPSFFDEDIAHVEAMADGAKRAVEISKKVVQEEEEQPESGRLFTPEVEASKKEASVCASSPLSSIERTPSLVGGSDRAGSSPPSYQSEDEVAELRSALTRAENNITLLQIQRRRIKARQARQARELDTHITNFERRAAGLQHAQDELAFDVHAAEASADRRFDILHDRADDHARRMENILDRLAEQEQKLELRMEEEHEDAGAFVDDLKRLIADTIEIRNTASRQFEDEIAAMRSARAEAATSAVVATATAQPDDFIMTAEPPRATLKRKRTVADVDEVLDVPNADDKNAEIAPRRPYKRLRAAATTVVHTVAAAAIGAFAAVAILSID